MPHLVEFGFTIPVREARYVPTICNGNIPLEGPDQILHVDLTPARGGNRIAEIEDRIRWAPPGTYEKHLVTGHLGSGKSTELYRLMKDLQTKKDDRLFHVVFFDIKEHLDPSDIQLPDLIAALFFALWKDPILDVPASATAKYLAKDIVGWIRALGVDVASDLTKAIPFLGTMLRNAELQRRFREKAWDHTARVIEQMGDLLQEVRSNVITRQGVEDVVIIIDNLEKMLCKDIGGGRTNHDLLFIEQLPKIEHLPVHMVITFPVSFHAEQVQLRTAYAKATAVQIPMVRVRKRGDHTPDAAGMKALRAFLAKRLDFSVIFSEDAAIDEAIAVSGGCARDLLRVIGTAVVKRGSVPIGLEDVRRAIGDEVSDFERVLQGNEMLPHPHSIEATGSLSAPIRAAQREWLLMNLIVTKDNGDIWYDVHPFARKTRAYRDSAPSP